MTDKDLMEQLSERNKRVAQLLGKISSLERIMPHTGKTCKWNFNPEAKKNKCPAGGCHGDIDCPHQLNDGSEFQELQLWELKS